MPLYDSVITQPACRAHFIGLSCSSRVRYFNDLYSQPDSQSPTQSPDRLIPSSFQTPSATGRTSTFWRPHSMPSTSTFSVALAVAAALTMTVTVAAQNETSTENSPAVWYVHAESTVVPHVGCAWSVPSREAADVYHAGIQTPCDRAPPLPPAEGPYQ